MMIQMKKFVTLEIMPILFFYTIFAAEKPKPLNHKCEIDLF